MNKLYLDDKDINKSKFNHLIEMAYYLIKYGYEVDYIGEDEDEKYDTNIELSKDDNDINDLCLKYENGGHCSISGFDVDVVLKAYNYLKEQLGNN